MAESKGGRDADKEELMDFCEDYDSDYKEDETDQERETEDEWVKETQSNDEKFCINTISDMRKDEEELPTKCEDPDLGPLKKSREVFSTADTSIMSIAGIADNNYHDDTFKFSGGKTTERFQIVKRGKDHSLQKDDGRMRGKESAQIEMTEALAKGWVKMLKEDTVQKDEKEELEESCCAEQKSQKKGPDKTYEKSLVEYPRVTGMLDEI
ncbi:hypothetical protein PIB30_032415 [Stylosanthes scabra]|uniref:Uncharacterized protein n=1 Tax=Stylosanthes scabra TaxID=79078 RepID=A0ABU6YB09_9FABA|nr:hypothetical protein [Stylosanthes scabra]